MNRDQFEALGNQQKAFEAVCAKHRLNEDQPVLVRLDGRSFHTFTKGLKRPFDERLSRIMIQTTQYLVAQMQAKIGYCQSDEISLVFFKTEPQSDLLFDCRSQKLCSVLAAMASVKFNSLLTQAIPEKADMLPVFDARVWNVPDLNAAAEHFLWRQADACRNSVSMAAQAVYPHRELQKVGVRSKLEMLAEKGIAFEDYPDFFKSGTFVARQTVMKSLTEQELSRIPQEHRPTGPVMRNEVVCKQMGLLENIENLARFLFFGEAPVLRELRKIAA